MRMIQGFQKNNKRIVISVSPMEKKQEKWCRMHEFLCEK